MPSLLFHIRNKVKISSGNSIEIHKDTRIRECHISIKGTKNLLVIEKGANLRGVQIEIDGIGCTLHIGKDSVVGEGCYLSSRERGTSLVIGERCMLSRNVKMMTSDGHDILMDTLRVNQAKSIKIGDHVWLADCAVILKGCSIGDDSVVGINSVVTKNIPGKCIAAGNPARVIKDSIIWNSELNY
ncbi:acyltransferase [Grimontia marina]|uniref:Galactoside O-acetyltransferase n=1 Tax=Grimontia marina TaxID=646534 RepID=A0A128F049_9GAMM|nr:acyltransferase [Grimontia marina]CZF80173.1 Galactoside O-acetyltransferase [Grimontia marina]